MGVTPEASKTHPLVLLGPLAEASMAPPAGLLVHLLQADQVPLAVFVMGVTPEASMDVAALGAFMEEVMEEAVVEAIGKLKEKGWEKDPYGPSFFLSNSAGILGFTHLSSRSKSF
jgi:hypothetical protein